jgi:hypothetical protein
MAEGLGHNKHGVGLLDHLPRVTCLVLPSVRNHREYVGDVESDDLQAVDRAERESLALRAFLRQAAEAVVVAGHEYPAEDRGGPHALARVDDRAALDALRSALELDPRAVRMDWTTSGEPTIGLYTSDRDFLGAVTLLLPNYIRSSALFDGDALLVEPTALAAWLASHVAGVQAM